MKFTAAHSAAFEGEIATVIILLKQGWSWWAEDSDGQTVCDILKKEGFNREAEIIKKKFNCNRLIKISL